MMGEDPDAARPHEELVPGWHVPDRTRYDYDLRIGDAERDIAKTQRQVDRLLADLPRPPRHPRAARPEAALPVPAPDAGRFLVFAMLLFALATWILIMAWMARHSYYGQLPQFPHAPGGG
jgi:hypothetical protein